ncbi:hypothetical protein [Cellulomonas sp. ES6]|uniref:hypothetical protein n=1 Tax=Cellulomonas sp. ES6 TaxID=3039384 RepID=UPI0024B737F5|nr:hypothetical protein [Cellulomonas sp. ES6]WHP18823.1 hypothetical protein P9841_06820 [Cellulomonas sp. ES6]
MDWLLNATNWLHAYTARWHDTWEIAGAIATTAAVFIAVAGIQREHKATEKAESREAAALAERDAERKQREASEARSRDEARRAQAMLVIAYPRFKASMVTGGGRAIGAWQVLVSNHSTAPIFDVHVEAFLGETRDAFADTSVLPPGEIARLETTELRPDAAEPGSVVYFRDLQNVRWRRYQDGTLAEVDDNRQPI